MNIVQFDSDPVYGDNDKYIKTKIKMYEDRVYTNFQGKKVPKENASYKFLSLIMLDSVMENLINDDLDLNSSDQSDNESDNESDSESNSESDN